MRFDFHWTAEGWRISEVNSDVPGGFIEASGFAEIMNEYYSSYAPPPNPASSYADAIAATAGNDATIGLVHATANSDDAQVMHYLAQGLQRKGLRAVVIGPNHFEMGVRPRANREFVCHGDAGRAGAIFSSGMAAEFAAGGHLETMVLRR